MCIDEKLLRENPNDVQIIFSSLYFNLLRKYFRKHHIHRDGYFNVRAFCFHQMKIKAIAKKCMIY